MSEIMTGFEIEVPIIWGEIGRIISVTNEQVKHYADFQIYFIGVTSTILIVALLIYIVTQIKRGTVTNFDSLRVSLEELLKDNDKNSKNSHGSKAMVEKDSVKRRKNMSEIMSGFEVEIPMFWKEDSNPLIGGIFGIENEKHQIFLEKPLTHEDKKMNARDYKYYNFEEEIEAPLLIKDLKEFISNYDFSQVSTKHEATILEFTVDFKNNFYFKGFYFEGENCYDSARYVYDVENLGKEHMTSKSNIAKYFINRPEGCINYAELLLDVVNQTDNENWEYFSEDGSVLAKDFLNYGYFSRILMMRDYETKSVVPVGYVQLRVLKNTAPQLLYKDLYHQAGLEGLDLWEKTSQLKAGLPIYIDVIAIKKEYQGKTGVLKLVPVALLDIIDEINNITQESFDIYAVGVTDEGRKMCKMFGMEFLSEVLRKEGNTTHTRVLFCSNYSDFVRTLETVKSIRKATSRLNIVW